MNKPTQQSELGTSENQTDHISKKRRSFVKGSAAALPVVLTLRNGSAFAAESMSCLAKQAGATPDTIVKTADNFVRVETVCRMISLAQGGGGSGFLVYQYPVGTNRWYVVGENSTSNGYFYVTNPPNPPRMEKNGAPGVKYKFAPGQADIPGFILVMLDPISGKPVKDSNGNAIVGPKGSNQPNVVATQSCMASLTA